MNSPSKLLVIVVVLLTFFSVGVVYWNTMIVHDFAIVDDTEEENRGGDANLTEL